MKEQHLIIALSLLFALPCLGQTQMELTQQAGTDDYNAEVKMNSVYKKVLNIYRADTLFTRNLKGAQKAWIHYRAFQVNAMFPAYTDHRYGTMISMCVSEYNQKLTEDRTLELEKWLMGSDEDDCSSSVKSKDELPPYKR
jgi:uncharacterized protein YecT (DUF1311 family)